MKRFGFLFIGLLVSTLAFAHKDSITVSSDSIQLEIKDLLFSIKNRQDYIGKYKIYQTENIYILLKLDTTTGRIEMIQWNLDKEKEFELYINNEDFSYGILSVPGRFELYPTKNMYQFILIDTLFGTTWHVQWGTKLSEQWIRRIY